MSMTLTSGRESRLDGAPTLPDPEKEARTRAVAIHLLNQIGEPITEESLRAIMPDAERMAEQYSTPQFEAAAIEANRAGMDTAVEQGTANAATRATQRQSARGVVPEDLPADEYGSVSARTVRDANMSLSDQEASLNQFQDLVDAETRDLREGRFHGANAQARQYEQDYGLPTNPSATGKTDLDYLREIQQHQGFIRTGRGEMIPVGPAPTPESIASRRDFDEWGNETPGSERQARYFPAEYETFREGVRNDIREDARQNMATYGTGPTWQLEQQAGEGARVESGQELGEVMAQAGRQLAARQERAASEGRVRDAQRGRFYEDKLRDELGEAAEGIAPGDTDALERAAFRQRNQARKRDLEQRRAAVADRGRLRGAGLPAGFAEIPEGDRAEAIRGLIPNRNAADGLEGAELGLKRDDLEARREADRQRFEAMMKNMELEAQEARQRADDARMRWEEEQRVGRERFEEETARYREGRETAEEARRLEAEERQKDRDARAKEQADADARARDMPQLEAGARSQVDENKQEMEQRAAERAEQAALRNAQLMNDQRAYGEGVLHIMAGNYDTPEARKSLQNMARDSDNSYFGYYQSDAESFDGTLARLGVKDPATRHALVQRYGLSISDGRGGWGSSLYNLLTGVDFPQR